MAGTRLIYWDGRLYSPPWPVDPQTSVSDAEYPFRCQNINYPGDPDGDSMSLWGHIGSSWMCPGNEERPARPGLNYYFHHQICTHEGQIDPYLCDDPPGIGRVSNNTATYSKVGDGSSYPTGQSPVNLSQVLTTDYLFGRFWFRLTDNWGDAAIMGSSTTVPEFTFSGTVQSATISSVTFTAPVTMGLFFYNIIVTHNGVEQARGVVERSGTRSTITTCTPFDTIPSSGDTFLLGPTMGHPWSKFIRLGTTQINDIAGPNIHLSAGCYTDGQYRPASGIGWAMGVFSRQTDWTTYRPPISVNFHDGQWHCIAFKWHTLRHSSSGSWPDNPNGEISFWIDNWNCDPAVNAAVCDREPCYFVGITATNYRMTQIYIYNNWNATYPARLMGLDVGKLEVWDGDVTTADLAGSTSGETPLTYDGVEHYWRIRTRDEGGKESDWSPAGGANYFILPTTSYSTESTSSSSSTSTTSSTTTTTSVSTTAIPTAPEPLYSNNTVDGARTGRRNPTDLIDPTPVFSSIAVPVAGEHYVTHVKLQVSTDASFATVDKWNSGWIELAERTAEGDRVEDIEYGRE